MQENGTARIYVGHLSYQVSDKDLEYFFRGYGEIYEIVLKQGFAFVDFLDIKDAEDAIHDLNGQDLKGERVRLDWARERQLDGGDGAFGVNRPKNRLIVENLSTQVTWQDLRDLFPEACFAEAHQHIRGEGMVEFYRKDAMLRAMETHEGKEVHGKKITLVELQEKTPSPEPQRSPSRSRSRSPRWSRYSSRSLSSSSSDDSSSVTSSPYSDSEDERDRKKRKRKLKRRRKKKAKRRRRREKERLRRRPASPSPERQLNSDGEELDVAAAKATVADLKAKGFQAFAAEKAAKEARNEAEHSVEEVE